MYHYLFCPDDSLKELPWVYTLGDDDALIKSVQEYFTQPVSVITYPSKAYAVAVIYAKLLKRFFGVPIIESLKDDHLLYGNDRFFSPYEFGKTDYIYKNVLFIPIQTRLPQVASTIDYFYDEFFIKPNEYFDNSTLINTPILDEEL